MLIIQYIQRQRLLIDIRIIELCRVSHLKVCLDMTNMMLHLCYLNRYNIIDIWNIVELFSFLTITMLFEFPLMSSVYHVKLEIAHDWSHNIIAYCDIHFLGTYTNRRRETISFTQYNFYCNKECSHVANILVVFSKHLWRRWVIKTCNNYVYCYIMLRFPTYLIWDFYVHSIIKLQMITRIHI